MPTWKNYLFFLACYAVASAVLACIYGAHESLVTFIRGAYWVGFGFVWLHLFGDKK